MSDVRDDPQGPIAADHRHGVSRFAHAHVNWRTANANMLKGFVDEIYHKRLGITVEDLKYGFNYRHFR
jgi:hypothetical protein